MEKPPESPPPESPQSRDSEDAGNPIPHDASDKAGSSEGEPPEKHQDTDQPVSSPSKQALPGNNEPAQPAEAVVKGQNTDSHPETPLQGDPMNLDMILDIPLEITVELGRAQIPIKELLQMGPGSAVPLSKLEGEPVDILANDRLIAKGIVLVKDEKYGIRITEITGRLKRLRGLR